MAYTLNKNSGIVTAANVDHVDVSFPSLPAAGDLVVVFVSNWRGGGSGVLSAADNQGNGAYTVVRHIEDGGSASDGMAMFYKENIGAPSGTFTVTVTSDQSSSYFSALILSYSGGLTTSPLRDAGLAHGAATATDANVTTDGTAAQVGDLVVACAMAALASSTNVHFGAAASSGYTNAGTDQNYSAISSLSVDYKTVVSGGAQSASWSHDDTTAGGDGWDAIVAVFIPLSAGGGPAPIFFARRR